MNRIRSAALRLCALICALLCLSACATEPVLPQPTPQPPTAAPTPTPEPPFVSDCPPEAWVSIGSKPEYLLCGAFLTAQGDFLYYLEQQSIRKTNGRTAATVYTAAAPLSCLNVQGDFLYFLQDGALCSIRTDGQLLHEGILQNLRRFVIFQDMFYCVDMAGNAFSMPVSGGAMPTLINRVDNLFVFQDSLFFCTVNDDYGFDLCRAGVAMPLLQNAALFGVCGEQLCAETATGLILLNADGAKTETPIAFSRLPFSLCGDETTLFFVTREGRLCAQALTGGPVQTLVEDGVRFAVTAGDALIYQTEEGLVRSCTKEGWQRCDAARGIQKRTPAEDAPVLSCSLIQLRNENGPLRVGETRTLSLLLDGEPLPPEEAETLLRGLFFESRDEEIAVVDGARVTALAAGSVAVRVRLVADPAVFGECLLTVETAEEG